MAPKIRPRMRATVVFPVPGLPRKTMCRFSEVLGRPACSRRCWIWRKLTSVRISRLVQLLAGQPPFPQVLQQYLGKLQFARAEVFVRAGHRHVDLDQQPLMQVIHQPDEVLRPALEQVGMPPGTLETAAQIEFPTVLNRQAKLIERRLGLGAGHVQLF